MPDSSKKLMSTVAEDSSLRVRVARKVIQAYRLTRGKDRLYLMLRSVLRLPRFLVVNLDEDLRFNCDLDEYLQRWIFCHGAAADADFCAMHRILRDGDHFVDVGANIGIFSLLGSKRVGVKGQVYSVEAAPSIQTKLQTNLIRNGSENVKIIPLALSNKSGVVSFFVSTGGNNGASSLSSNTPDGERITVQARALDSLIEDGTIHRCDVLKMDIEGAEPLALQGMIELFETSPPRAVMIEIAESLLANFSATPADVINFFVNHGYSWHRATSRGFEKLNDLNIGGFQNLWAIRQK